MTPRGAPVPAQGWPDQAPSPAALDVRIKFVESATEKHDTRITNVERWQARTSGILATLATLGSLVGSGVIAPLILHALKG